MLNTNLRLSMGLGTDSEGAGAIGVPIIKVFPGSVKIGCWFSIANVYGALLT